MYDATERFIISQEDSDEENIFSYEDSNDKRIVQILASQ
jgi:hypothetical protein